MSNSKVTSLEEVFIEAECVITEEIFDKWIRRREERTGEKFFDDEDNELIEQEFDEYMQKKYYNFPAQAITIFELGEWIVGEQDNLNGMLVNRIVSDALGDMSDKIVDSSKFYDFISEKYGSELFGIFMSDYMEEYKRNKAYWDTHKHWNRYDYWEEDEEEEDED